MVIIIINHRNDHELDKVNMELFRNDFELYGLMLALVRDVIRCSASEFMGGS